MDESIIGKTIDNYEILEEIGRGGMGVVYKAMDVTLEKIVALKMIDPTLARDENFLRRFKTEARALAKLQNEHIITVHALRETEFGVFIVMECVQAKTLADWIEEKGPFSWEEALPTIKQLLNAIGHAHKASIIHRDIKPRNILLCEDGRVKVTDFGLAKDVEKHGSDSTVTQIKAGTLYYMSPEQVKGLKQTDKRSDIYSLGMTIYEMLTGRTPFDKTESDFSIQKQIVEGNIPSPDRFNSTIPKDLVKIVKKAIYPDSTKRYQEIEEISEDIKKFESSKIGELAPEITIKKSIYQQPLFYVLLSLIIMIIIFLYLNFRTPSTPEPSLEDMSYFTISTNPPGVVVFFNEDSIGRTPLNNVPYRTGRFGVHLQKEGYTSHDTILVLRKDRLNSFNFSLLRTSPVFKEEIEIDKFLVEFEINSVPSEASVFINNVYTGRTPYHGERKPGKYNIRISHPGYADYYKLISVTENFKENITASLKPISTLEIKTEPPGAKIYINDRFIAYTPFEDKKFVVGNCNILLEKEGYKKFSTSFNVRHDQKNILSHSLIPLEGNFKILVLPWGSIYIDGVLKVKESVKLYEVSIPVGYHKIKAYHPQLGEWEKNVEIKQNTSQEFVINFNENHRLTLTSEPNYCEIYIDGKNTGNYTPKEIKLRTGKHTISVHKDGYSLSEGVITINIDDDLKDPIHFKLKRIK